MLRAIRLKLSKGCRLRRCDIARSDAVTLDVVLAIFRCDISGKHLKAALGCCISRNRFSSQLAHHRANIDDLSVALLDHSGDHCLRHNKGSDQVNIDHFRKFRDIHLFHRNTLDDPGIIYQNIYHSQSVFDIF